jgi:hypothetical protein
MSDILKQKTTWTGITAIITALGGYFTQTMDASTAIQLGLGGLTAIFLRQGISKGK